MATTGAPASASDIFVGRRQQLEQLHSCVAEVRNGVSWIVGIGGEAGIGKTALVRHLVESLEGFGVLWASCDPTEQDNDFGTVDQLIRRVPPSLLADSDGLARGAFGNAAPVAVGAELTRLIAAAQASGPLALVVDDVQWSDPASRAVLGYMARRLWRERVLTLLTMRTGLDAQRNDAAPELWWQRVIASSEHGLHIHLAGMDESEIAQMAQASNGESASPATVSRLLSRTSGHPLYLHSLLNEAPSGALADPSQPLAVPASLASATRRALERLTPDSRSLVEALAILGNAVPLPLAAQVAGVTAPAAALGPALDLGLVQWWPGERSSPVRIRHGLQQEVISQKISPPRRRKLHAAAASIVDTSAAWAHRVAAADRVDPALAAELEMESDRLGSIGQLSRAATLMLWASNLSEDREGREQRLLTGAIRLLLARDYSRCRGLHDAVDACTSSVTRTCVLGGLAYARADLQAAGRYLTQAIRGADADGLAHIAELACLWLGATYTRRHQGHEALPLLLRAAGLNLPEPRAVNYARHLLTLASDAAAGSQPATADRHRDTEADVRAALAASLLLNPRGILREMAHELHTGLGNFKTLVRRQRVGEVSEIQVSEYFTLAAFQYLSGVWDDAAVTAHDTLTLATSSGELFGFAAGHAIASMAAANQGRWDVAHEQLRASERAAQHTQLPSDQIHPVLARVILGQANNDPGLMDQALRRLPVPSTGWQSWWLPLQVEACIGTARLDEAADALGRLEALTEDVPSLQVTACWLAGDLSMARGEPGKASTAYIRGLALPPHADDIPLHRARLEHAYGKMLLLTDRDTALLHLRKAHSAYQVIGAVPFARRAAAESAELTAPDEGEPEEHGAQGVITVLTKREREVATLASEGMTNKEIAKTLVLSTKTIEYHLGRVFAKLELTSRRQLRTVLANEGRPDARG